MSKDITNIKLSDFGLSTFYKEGKILKEKCGTPGYMAPEMMRCLGYDCKIDIYASGSLLYYLLYGKGPFSSNDTKSVVVKNRVGKFTFPPTGYFHSNETIELIKSMMKIDPSKRFGVKDCLLYSVIKDIEIDITFCKGKLEDIEVQEDADPKNLLKEVNLPSVNYGLSMEFRNSNFVDKIEEFGAQSLAEKHIKNSDEPSVFYPFADFEIPDEKLDEEINLINPFIEMKINKKNDKDQYARMSSNHVYYCPQEKLSIIIPDDIIPDEEIDHSILPKFYSSCVYTPKPFK